MLVFIQSSHNKWCLFFCHWLFHWRQTTCFMQMRIPRDVWNSKVRKQDKFRRDWSRHYNTCESQRDRTRCPEELASSLGKPHHYLISLSFIFELAYVKFQSFQDRSLLNLSWLLTWNIEHFLVFLCMFLAFLKPCPLLVPTFTPNAYITETF